MEIHHVAHVFQVVTAARLRDRTIGRSRIAFVHTVDVRGRRTVPLDLRGPAHGVTEPRWRVLMNAPLEIDA